MNCKECKNLLIEYMEDFLDASRKADIEKHLEECPMCRKEAENTRALQGRLMSHSRNIDPVHFEDAVMDRIQREESSGTRAAESAGFLYQLRSLIMKNTMIKIAAAAVIVLAVIIGLNSFQNNITFARVVDSVLNARTIAYDIIFGDPAEGSLCLSDIDSKSPSFLDALPE